VRARAPSKQENTKKQQTELVTLVLYVASWYSHASAGARVYVYAYMYVRVHIHIRARTVSEVYIDIVS